MKGLPQGWAASKLEDVCDFNPKHSSDADQSQLVSFVPMPAVSEHSGAIYGAVDRPLSEILKGYTHFADGDVIFAKITPCMENGKAAVARGLTNGIACGSTEFHVLRSKGAVLPDYVWRFMRQDSFRRDAEARMTGAVGQRRVPKPYLEQHEIPLPPLPEQRRIVRKLDTLSARSTTARTHLTAIEKLVERYRRAVTERLFEELSAEHGEVALGELCERITKGASPNWQGFEYGKEGIVFVRSQNVLWGELDLTDTAFLPPAFNDKQRNSVICENDVLLNIVGASIGRSAVATSAISGANCNQAVAVIRLKSPTPNDARYVSQWLTSPAGQAQITENAVDVARANFSLGQAKQLKLPWPPEEVRMETLAKIETAFAKIDSLAAEAAKALKLLGHLDQRILAKAFAGDLVPQDPTDEPAETLLARIRETRAAAPKSRRGRK